MAVADEAESESCAIAAGLVKRQSSSRVVGKPVSLKRAKPSWPQLAQPGNSWLAADFSNPPKLSS